MIIDQLPNLASVQETDEIPVERGTTTYKTTLQKLKNLIASLLTKTDVGLGNVDNVQQYSADNPPPYPVSSVNGQTGAVEIPVQSLIEIPYSAFSWNASTSAFVCQNIYTAADIPRTPKGFFVSFTNGAAIAGTRLNGNQLSVMGWIPNAGQSVGNTYQFLCYAVI